MIDEGCTQDHGDRLLHAWGAIQDAHEQEDEDGVPEDEASFGRFSDMVNTMMDRGVLGEVMENLNDRMDRGEIEIPSDMVMDIIDSLCVCINEDNEVWQLVGVPLSGPSRGVLNMANQTNWNQAMENFGIVEGQYTLLGVVRDTEMSLLMLDVEAVGALARGLAGESIHGVFLDDTQSGEFHGMALLRCHNHFEGSDLLGEVLNADKQDGSERWSAALSDHGRIVAQGPRLPREAVAEAAAWRAVSTLERLRATEADQGRPGLSRILFGFDPDRSLAPDELCWMAGIYKDGTAASIQAMPAALVPVIPAACSLIELQHGIEALPIGLPEMFAQAQGARRQLGGISAPPGRRLH